MTSPSPLIFVCQDLYSVSSLSWWKRHSPFYEGQLLIKALASTVSPTHYSIISLSLLTHSHILAWPPLFSLKSQNNCHLFWKASLDCHIQSSLLRAPVEIRH
jgi:hypothetical protein